MSDVIATDEDERNAQKLFMRNDKYDVEIIAWETARHRRVLRELSEKVGDMHRCVKGDPATGYIGSQSMIEEIYKRETGKEPKTDALEKNDKDNAMEKARAKWDDLSKYVWMGVGIVGTLYFLLPLIWDKVIG